MHSNNENNKTNTQNDPNSKKKKNKNIKLFLTIFLFITILLVVLTVIYLFFFDSKIKISLSNDNANIISKMAEDFYNNGFLENSAIYYRNYIKTNPSKMKKIRAYEKLFEINVINKNYGEAISILDEWSLIDKNDPKIYLNKTKLLLRTKKYDLAQKEIDFGRKKYGKSTEFKELAGIYYIETESYQNALNEFLKIPFGKREFNIHKNIIYSYILLKNEKEALNYTKLLDKKMNTIEDRKNREEYCIIKSIVLLLNNLTEEALDNITKQSFLSNYNNIATKLILISNLALDNEKEISTILSNNEDIIYKDPDFLSILGDYYISNGNYPLALDVYKKIPLLREYTIEELFTLADIYFWNREYQKSIETIFKVKESYNKSTPTIYKNLSLNYKKLNDYKNSMFYLDEGLNLYKDDFDFYFRMARLFFDIGDYNGVVSFIAKNRPKILENNPKSSYIEKLDLLDIFAKSSQDMNVSEYELLALRERGGKNPDYYFKLIEYYLINSEFSNVKRELDRVSSFDMDKNRKEILLNYKLIYGYNNDNSYYNNALMELSKIDNPSIQTRFNLSLSKVLESDYKEAMKILNFLEINNSDITLTKKIIYIKALIYFLEGNYPSSYQMIIELNNLSERNNKISYLKRLLDSKDNIE